MKIVICYYQADADEKRKTQTVEAGEGARYIKPVRDDPRSAILSMKADDKAVAYIVSRLVNIPYAVAEHRPVETTWRGHDLAFILDNIDFDNF